MNTAETVTQANEFTSTTNSLDIQIVRIFSASLISGKSQEKERRLPTRRPWSLVMPIDVKIVKLKKSN